MRGDTLGIVAQCRKTGEFIEITKAIDMCYNSTRCSGHKHCYALILFVKKNGRGENWRKTMGEVRQKPQATRFLQGTQGVSAD